MNDEGSSLSEGVEPTNKRSSDKVKTPYQRFESLDRESHRPLIYDKLQETRAALNDPEFTKKSGINVSFKNNERLFREYDVHPDWFSGSALMQPDSPTSQRLKRGYEFEDKEFKREVLTKVDFTKSPADKQNVDAFNQKIYRETRKLQELMKKKG